MTQQSLLDYVPDYGGAADFWPTPECVIDAIIPVLQQRLALRGSPAVDLLDPGCGEGVILDVVSRTIATRHRIGVEIDLARAQQARQRTGARIECFDFLSDATPSSYACSVDGHKAPTVVVMNSPYSEPRDTIGLEFAEQAIRVATPSKGLVVALLPLDYACGKKRVERLHDKYRCGLYPLKSRPKFANGQTGKRPVAWFTWDLLNPYSEWGVLPV